MSLVLYHDYRSGSFRDWSGNGHHGTPTLAGLTREGADFHAQANLVTVPYASGLDLGGGSAFTIVSLLPNNYGGASSINRGFLGQSGGILVYIYKTGTYAVVYVGAGGAALTGIQSQIEKSKCFSFEWTNGTAPKLYCDGVFAGTFDTVLASSSDTSDIVIGNRSLADLALGQTMSAIQFYNHALTATEHAQVYADLVAKRWPTKTISHASGRVHADRDAVASYDMRPVGGKIQGHAYPLTVDKQVWRHDGLFNEADGHSLNTGITATQLNPRTTDHTVSGWFKLDSLPGATAYSIFGRGMGNLGFSAPGMGAIYVLDAAASNFISYSHYDTVAVGYKNVNTTFAAKVGVWYHAAYVLNYTTGLVYLYVNGAPIGSVAIGTMYYHATSDADGFRVFGIDSSHANLEDAIDTTIRNLSIYSEAKSADWVLAEYQKGARQVTFKTDFGARETIAAVGTPGPITNTPWEVVSGTFEIITTTINGTPVKAIRCATAGAIAIPSSLFRLGEAGAARGGFKWWMYKKSDANQADLWIVSGAKTPANGYLVRFSGGSNRFQMMRDASSLGYTPVSYVSILTWHKVEVTVGDGGVFTTYLDGTIVDPTGGFGTNPATDATYSTSKFLVADLDAGDMIALGSVDGEYALEKMLGVSNER